jgi:bacterioferritin
VPYPDPPFRKKETANMQGHPEIIDFLNRALRHEMTAVNQYWLHYRLLDDWGYAKLAAKQREESIEEMQHADKLVDRIIFLDGFPNMQTLDPLQIGQDIREILESDLKAERSARELYTEARDKCQEHRDYVSMKLFEELLKDEEGHIDWLETQLALLDQIGVQLYGQLQAGDAKESD